jgi:Domain of unknown function (DUF4602)
MVTSSAKPVHPKGSLHKVPKKRNVEVVSCTASFPISQKRHRPAPERTRGQTFDGAPKSSSINSRKSTKNSDLLDWNETAREVHKFGASGWKQDTSLFDPKLQGATGQSRVSDRKKYRLHKEEEYKRLTGREMKHHSVPLPIVRGIKKKAQQREQRQWQEAKEAGIIVPLASSSSRTKQEEKKRKNFTTNRVYGPAPSIGFVKQGVFRVPGKKK